VCCFVTLVHVIAVIQSHTVSLTGVYAVAFNGLLIQFKVMANGLTIVPSRSAHGSTDPLVNRRNMNIAAATKNTVCQSSFVPCMVRKDFHEKRQTSVIYIHPTLAHS
jgi:hypothetical protein